jgi:hypothetical protein
MVQCLERRKNIGLRQSGCGFELLLLEKNESFETNFAGGIRF